MLTRGERRALDMLERRLPGRTFQISHNVRLAEVLRPRLTHRLRREDESFLLNSHLDFVIGNRRTQGLEAVFGVEFDEHPSHDEDPVQIANDYRKNRLCMLGGLPLLRIASPEIERHEGLSLLEFMLERFMAAQRDRQRILNKVEDWNAPLRDREGMTAEVFFDEAIDPSMVFDWENPFPGIRKVARQLLRALGIASDYVPAPMLKAFGPERLRVQYMGGVPDYPEGYYMARQRFIVFTHPAGPGYRISSREGETVVEGGELLYDDWTWFAMRWVLPVEEDRLPGETSAAYWHRTGKPLIIFNSELPGMQLPGIVESFCTYLALRQVEQWASDDRLRDKSEPSGP